MIGFENVTSGPFEDASFEISEGTSCKIVVSSDTSKRAFLNILLGLARPEKGKVFLFGQDIWAIKESALYRLFKRIGVVYEEEGLISNLKVWSNIALPVWYHQGKGPKDIENKVQEIFIKLGFDSSILPGYMARATGGLTQDETRIITLVRAMLMDSELMIYDSLITELDPETARRVLLLTQEFHTQRQGRTSIYIADKEQALQGIQADIVLRNQGKGFVL